MRSPAAARDDRACGGNGPDVLDDRTRAAETPISVCVLGPAGDLAPMIKAPWTKRSLPFVTSLDKYGQALVAFSPQVAPEGVFTNNALFGKLGLKVPQTFPQLLGPLPAGEGGWDGRADLGRGGRGRAVFADPGPCCRDGVREGSPLDARAEGGDGHVRGQPRLASGAPGRDRHEHRRLFRAWRDGDRERLRGGGVRSGAGPDAARTVVAEGQNRRLEPAVRLLVLPVPGRNGAEPDQDAAPNDRLAERQCPLEPRKPGRRADLHRLHRPAQAGRPLRRSSPAA